MRRDRANWGKHLLRPAGVFLLSLLAVLLITWQFSNVEKSRDRLRFETRVDLAQHSVQSRLNTYVAMLRATAGFFAASNSVTLKEFRAYVSRLELQQTYPGIQGIGLTLRLPPERVASFEEEMRAGGMEDFRVWPKDPREEYHTIIYLEPMDKRNREAIGYDMFTDEVRRKAMAAARDHGMPEASGRVTLVQEITEDVQAGFLIYVPIYKNGAVPESIEARREMLLGYVYAAFRAGDLMRGAFGTDRRLAIDVTAYHGHVPSDKTMLFDSAGYSIEDREDFEPRFSARRTLMVAGQPWSMVYRNSPAFEEASSRLLVPVVLISGLLLSAMLAAITWAEANARERSERTAAELRRSQRELQESRQRLIENDRRKDEFLATLAHELRNPLAPIYNALQVIRMSGVNKEIFDEFSGIMQSQIDQLVRLVDDLMDVSRITRGKIKLVCARTSVKSLLDNALQVVGPAIREKGQMFSVDLPPEEIWVNADFARASQIFSNLIGNASKYTPEGGRIRVFAALEDHCVKIGIEDSGIGIPADKIDYIFDAFTQVENSISRSQGGLGIGLMLVRRLAHMHGGRVEAESPGEGLGSTFYVYLPLYRQEAHGDHKNNNQTSGEREHRMRKVLIVDDNEESAFTLAQAMEIFGHDVRQSTDPNAGLEIAKIFRPDVVLLDIGMPGMNGYDLCRIMRDDLELGNATFIAQTGWGQDEHRARSREAGFDHHLVKPVNIKELADFVAEGGR